MNLNFYNFHQFSSSLVSTMLKIDPRSRTKREQTNCIDQITDLFKLELELII